jgi:hypothetical protein
MAVVRNHRRKSPWHVTINLARSVECILTTLCPKACQYALLKGMVPVVTLVLLISLVVTSHSFSEQILDFLIR